MVLKLNGELMIENVQNYPAETVAKLRALLAQGAEAHPDPSRENFYDVVNGTQVFFVHVAPNGNVLLLASWQGDSQAARVESESTARES